MIIKRAIKNSKKPFNEKQHKSWRGWKWNMGKHGE